MNVFEAILDQLEKADEVEIVVPSAAYALALETGLKAANIVRQARAYLERRERIRNVREYLERLERESV